MTWHVGKRRSKLKMFTRRHLRAHRAALERDQPRRPRRKAVERT